MPGAVPSRALRLPAAVLAILAGSAALAAPRTAAAQGRFLRGDATGDRVLDITDPIAILGYLFLGAKAPVCLEACDVDDSGGIDLTDPISLLDFLYRAGSPPPPPWPAEGIDPTPDALGCANGNLPLSELRVAPPELVLYRPGDSQAIVPKGVVADGPPGSPAFLDLRKDPLTRYRAEPAGVVGVSPGGIVTALAPGTAEVVVENRALSARVPVRVLDGGPILRIASPPDGAVVAAASVTVSGSTGDPSAGVAVNGSAAAVDAASGLFTAAVDLAPGPNEIAAASGASSVRITVTRVEAGAPDALGPDGLPLPRVPAPLVAPSDTAPPAVRITSPSAGSVLPSAVIDVEGTVDDPAAEVRVGGVLAAVADGRFRARIALPAGAAVVEAEAADPVGNAAVDRVSVTVAPDLPSVAIDRPRARRPGGGGHAPRPGGPRLRLSRDGAGLPEPPGDAGDGERRAGVGRRPHLPGLGGPLAGPQPGGGDGGGPGRSSRRAVAVRRVALVLDAPEIEVVYPPDGFHASSTPLRVAGRVRIPGLPPGAWGPLAVDVNGVAAAAAGGGFEADVPLSAGSNALAVTAVGAGRTATRTLNVTLDPVGRPLLEVSGGAGQTAAPGAALPQQLAARARDAFGAPAPGIPVTFLVAAGDGSLAGARERTVMTDASGVARASFTAGTAAGRGLHLVTARSPGRSGSPVVFSTTVAAGPLAALTAHSPRWMAGAAGAPLGRPLAVRALDRAGNPLAGVAVEFETVSGDATVGGGTKVTLATGPAGIAAVEPVPGGPGDGRSVVTARAAGGFRVTFVVDGPGGRRRGEGRLAGTVADAAGSPLAGRRVSCADVPGLEAVSDAGGGWELRGIPSGPAPH